MITWHGTDNDGIEHYCLAESQEVLEAVVAQDTQHVANDEGVTVAELPQIYPDANELRYGVLAYAGLWSHRPRPEGFHVFESAKDLANFVREKGVEVTEDLGTYLMY